MDILQNISFCAPKKLKWNEEGYDRIIIFKFRSQEIRQDIKQQKHCGKNLWEEWWEEMGGEAHLITSDGMIV